jgi:predicted dehydrogenase
MRIAIVGCGFVADFYMESLPLYPVLELVGVADRDADRAARFSSHHGIANVYPDLDSLLADQGVEMVLNLTNPREHYTVSKACLQAGKHVYSEKPFAMNMDEARELVDLAAHKNVRLASAPGNVLGETAQALWKAIREERVGRIKLVYAEMDDGLVFRMPYRKWVSASGRPWPWKDEFEVGCTMEHAGYYVTWFTAFFGPAVSVTAFSSCLYPDKETDAPLDNNAPDFSVACIRFASGVVARLTCSIIAARDQRLRLFGDSGILMVDDSWNYREPVHIQRWKNVRRKMIMLPWRQRVPLPQVPRPSAKPRGGNPMEFCRGPAEVAEAVEQKRESRLPADYCLHNNEIVCAIQYALENSATYRMTTTFQPITPMPWA